MPPNNRKKKHRKQKQGSQSEAESSAVEQGDDESNDEGEEIRANFKIKESDVLGRYIVAARDLRAGEKIIEELPLVIGPCADSDPICLGCYIDLSLSDIRTASKCTGCGWPVCSAACVGLKQPLGHSSWECTALRKNRIADYLDKCKDEAEIQKMYETIMVFRCLLMKANDKLSYDKLLTMESHNGIRKEIPSLWNRNQKVIVERIRNEWKFNEFSEAEIHTICGVLEVNSFEVGQNNTRGRALYPTAFLLSHDCTPNTTHTDDPVTHKLTIRVTQPLRREGTISLSYSYTLQGTLKRREHLKECKFFWCNCKRCSDRTEMGTYTSALLCPKCDGGNILDEDPLDQTSAWKCQTCNYTVTAKSILLLVDRLFVELDSVNVNSTDDYEDFLKKYRNVLHKNHYLVLSAKHSLCQLYGRSEGHLIQDMSLECLKRKEEYCRELLQVVNHLEPGLTRLRGLIMYELHAPIMIQATRQFEGKGIDSKELRKRLKEVLSLLKLSEQILSFEPEGTSENMMALAARDAIKRIGNV